MGGDRPIVRIQGVGLVRAGLVKILVAGLGGQFLVSGQLLWSFRAADPLVEFQALGVPAFLRNCHILKNQAGDPPVAAHGISADSSGGPKNRRHSLLWR
jgi:hypothetical protein